jgi:hypothetical protein
MYIYYIVPYIYIYIQAVYIVYTFILYGISHLKEDYDYWGNCNLFTERYQLNTDDQDMLEPNINSSFDAE